MNNTIRLRSRDPKRLQSEFDKLVDSFFPVLDPTLNSGNVWSPRVDLSESEDSYFIELDVPGLDKDNIHINLHEGTLSISGERSIERKREGTDFVRIERKSGNFYRSFTLPKTVAKDGIVAEYSNGVLHITAPKAEESKPQRIEVK